MSRKAIENSPNTAYRNSELDKLPYFTLFKEGFVVGVGWAAGVTIGFVIISTILAVLLKNLGGLPLIGSGIASVVESTQEQLLRRSIVIPR